LPRSAAISPQPYSLPETIASFSNAFKNFGSISEALASEPAWMICFYVLICHKSLDHEH
jgi:hypothetical protein